MFGTFEPRKKNAEKRDVGIQVVQITCRVQCVKNSQVDLYVGHDLILG